MLGISIVLRQKQELFVTLIECICLALVFPTFNFAASNRILRYFLMQQPITSRNMHIKYSYIDKTGRIVIAADQFESITHFSEGLAGVYLVNKGWGFIDKSGKEVIEPQFQQASSFSEGLAGVQLEGRWGFIDKTAQIRIEPRYDVVNSFSEGVAVVVKDNEVLLINRTGQTILSRSMDELQLNIYENARFSEGLIDAYDCAKAKTGFMDKTGKFVIEPKFDEAGPFSEGLARVTVVEDGEEKLGFIDHSGQFVIPPTFNTDADFRRNSTDFSEGLASVTEGLRPTVTEEEKFVYIDKKGTIVLFTDFFYTGPFRDGMAVVYDTERNKSGFIDRSGKIAIQLQYDSADDFSEGLACVGVITR